MPFYYYDKLRQAVPIAEVLEHYTGMPIDQKTNKAHCPAQNHADAHPSVQINVGGRYPNTCYCHTCNRPFDVLTVIKETCDLGTDAAAAERLISDFGLDRSVYCKTREVEKERPILSAPELKMLDLTEEQISIPNKLMAYTDILTNAFREYQWLSGRVADQISYLSEECFDEQTKAPTPMEHNLEVFTEYKQQMKEREEGPLREAYEAMREKERLAFESVEDAREYREGGSYKRRPFKCSQTFEEFCRQSEPLPYPVLYDNSGVAVSFTDVPSLTEFAEQSFGFDAWVAAVYEVHDNYTSIYCRTSWLYDCVVRRDSYLDQQDEIFGIIERVMPLYQNEYKATVREFEEYRAGEGGDMTEEEAQSVREMLLPDLNMPQEIEKRLQKESRISLRLPVKKEEPAPKKATLRLVRASGISSPPERKEDKDRC